MENRLNIKTLKVIDYAIFVGRSCLSNLHESKSFKRMYSLDSPVCIAIYTTQGTLNIGLSAPFMFDGRSGSPLLDWYAPNLGTIEERLAWLVHDVNGYAKCLSFKDTNTLLFAMLRDLCHYRKTKAAAIRYAVSLSKGWYGKPEPTDKYFVNYDKIQVKWVTDGTDFVLQADGRNA